jgi:hypothetical protein
VDHGSQGTARYGGILYSDLGGTEGVFRRHRTDLTACTPVDSSVRATMAK